MSISHEALVVGCEIKRVIDLLFEAKKPLTAEQINEHVDEQVKGNKAFFEALAKSPKINFDGQSYSYRSWLCLRDQRLLVRAFAQADLKDANCHGGRVEHGSYFKETKNEDDPFKKARLYQIS